MNHLLIISFLLIMGCVQPQKENYISRILRKKSEGNGENIYRNS